MSDYDLPISEAHARALVSWKRMLDVLPKNPRPALPEKVAADNSDCNELFDIAGGLYGEAADAYLAGDVSSGQFYQSWAREYMAMARACVEAGGLDTHPF